MQCCERPLDFFCPSCIKEDVETGAKSCICSIVRVLDSDPAPPHTKPTLDPDCILKHHLASRASQFASVRAGSVMLRPAAYTSSPILRLLLLWSRGLAQPGGCLGLHDAIFVCSRLAALRRHNQAVGVYNLIRLFLLLLDFSRFN